MPRDDLTTRLDEAIACARAGGAYTLEAFHAGVVMAERKGDGTPVTATDRGCERLIRERIAASFPNDGMLGEEFGDEPGSSGYRWIIDPIDGTFSFMHGVPLYTTLIGIERISGDGGRGKGDDGEVVAGVIYAPALDEMVYAMSGGGAWHTVSGAEPTPARVSKTPTLAEATVSTTSLDYWDDPAGWLAIDRACAHTRGWADAYAVLLVATGRCDAVIESNVHPWDVAPFGPILAEAGGLFTDWRGRTTAHTDTVVVSNGLVHDALLGLVGADH